MTTSPFLKVVLLFVFGAFSIPAGAQHKAASALETEVRQVIARTAAATVWVSTYDSLRPQAALGNASGVVVSQEGIVLTAGHVSFPNRLYTISFPDGREVKATGLGRIGLLDVGLMKILEAGIYPFAEMGWSSSLKEKEPCISIAYPGSFSDKRMVVRFGYIAELERGRYRLMKTTSLMEPGDSGGPLFDLHGRVVGVHSRIQLSLEDNYEVSVDHFRRYWTALQQPVNYIDLPAEDPMPLDDMVDGAPFYPTTEVLAGFSQMEGELDNYCIALTSFDGSDTSTALGTLLRLDNLFPAEPSFRKGTFVVSKNSQVGSNPFARINGRLTGVKVVARDTERDLVLLQLPKRQKQAIDLQPAVAVTGKDLGKFLLSPHPENEGEISVLGTASFDLPRAPNPGFLGIRVVESEGGRNVIAMVQPRSAASAAGLAEGDEVVSIDGTAIHDPAAFTKEMQKRRPRDVISLVRTRANYRDTLKITLGARPPFTGNHIAERFADGKSARRDGFQNAFVHDSKLKPSECGGPIFDMNRSFIGVNMARLSRTSSIGVTTAEIIAFIEQAVQEKRSN